jgi:hypothetical protein
MTWFRCMSTSSQLVIAAPSSPLDDSSSVGDPCDLVLRARSCGCSWTSIGQALGITRQAAWERFSGER